MMSDDDRRRARDVSVVVNGHRPEVLVGGKDKLTAAAAGQSSVVHPAFTRTNYASERRGVGAGIIPGRQNYQLGKTYERSGVTVLGGRSHHIEPLIAASPTSVSPLSVSAAYVTPPPAPLRPNAVHASALARRLDAAARSKVFSTLTSFPEHSSALMPASHRVTLVDRLDATETHPSTSTFVPANVVASKDVDSGVLYFADHQPSTLLDSGAEQLRAGFAAPVWNSLTAGDIVADSEHATSSDRSPTAFSGGLSPAVNRLSEVSGGAGDDRRSSGDGSSTIVAERNFAVAQLMKRPQRPAPLGAACSTSGSSLLGHLTNTTRCVPVANVHPIMKDATQPAAAVTSTPSAELPASLHRLPPATDDETCSQLSIATLSVSSGRPVDPRPSTKDVTALMAAGLTRGGRVSSHQTEYVKFLSKKSDDTASTVASLSVVGGTFGSVRGGQQTVDKRRGGGSNRGGAACLSAKARRQLHFHHEDHSVQTVPDQTAAACDSEASTTNSRQAVSASCSLEDHSSCVTSSASTGRKTTPIVYFDDDESATEAPPLGASAVGTLSGSQRHGPSTPARKQSGKPRKIARADFSTEPGAGGKAVKRRKQLTVTRHEKSNVDSAAAAAAAADDDLTDFEDALPSTSAQVSFLRLKLCNVVSW